MGSGSSPRPAGGQIVVGPSFVGRTGLDDANHVHVHVNVHVNVHVRVSCARVVYSTALLRVARVPCYRPARRASVNLKAG